LHQVVKNQRGSVPNSILRATESEQVYNDLQPWRWRERKVENAMSKDQAIKNTYLFRGIAAEDLSALAQITEEAVLASGQLLYDIDQTSDAIVIIELGTIDIIVQGKQAPVATLGNGQTLGELGFFHPGNRFAVATARERTQVARIPFDKLASLLAERPALALLFYKNACDFLAKHVGELAIERDRRDF
jgi:CRP-like cAMP-binding protein